MKMLIRALLTLSLLASGAASAAISGTKVYGTSGTVGNGGWPATIDLTGHTPTAGNILVVCQMNNDDAPGSSATTPSGFTAGPTYSDGSAGALSGASFWKKAGGAESSISVTWSDTTYGGSYVYVELPGTDLDVDALGDSGENEANIASATTSLSSGSASNSTATGLAIACLSTDNLTNNDVTAWSNSFVEQQETDYGSTARGETFLATKVLSSAAAQSTAGTITSDQGYGSILVFNASGATCPATCAGGRSARCITDISDASDPDNLLYGLSPAAVANEDTVCYDATSVLGDTVNVTAAGWPSIASGGSQLTDSFDYCVMDNGAACGTDGTYEVTFTPVITSVTGIGTGQTTGTVTVTPAGPTEGTVRGVAILKSVYDLYGAPSHAQIAAGVDANYDGVSWGSEFTSDLATPDVWTNLLKYSADIRSTADAGEARPWLYSSTTVTSNTTTAPDGQTTADTITASATWGAVYQAVTLGTSTTYTLSVYTKPGTTTTSAIALYDTVGADFQGRVNITWTAGVPSTGSTSGTANNITYTSIGDGWYRVSFDTTSDSSNTGHGVYMYADTTSGNRTTVVWGAQLEAASTAGPYTPTVADARARFDGYTFSRASSQTYTKSDGTLGTVTSGNPAFTYSGGTAQGVLLEGARTNLALQSADFGTTWTVANASITTNTTTAPDGTSDADTFTAAATSHNLRQAITVSPGTTYTFSFYAKRGTMTDLQYSVYNNTGGSNIIAPTSYYSSTSGSAWSRISVTFTAPAGCVSASVYPFRDSGSTGTAFIWGAQLEAGAFASSYIPTTTGSVARVATSLTRSWTFDTNNFSGYLQAYPGFASTETSATNPVFSAYKDANNYLTITHPTTSGRMDLNLAIGGTTATAQVTGLTWAKGDKLDIRFRKSASGIKLWVEAGSTETTTGVAPNAFSTPPNTVRLGRDEGSNYGFWTVGNIQLWNSVDDTALGALN